MYTHSRVRIKYMCAIKGTGPNPSVPVTQVKAQNFARPWKPRCTSPAAATALPLVVISGEPWGREARRAAAKTRAVAFRNERFLPRAGGAGSAGRRGSSCRARPLWMPDASRLSLPIAVASRLVCGRAVSLAPLGASRQEREGHPEALDPDPEAAVASPEAPEGRPSPQGHSQPQGRVRCAVRPHGRAPRYGRRHGAGGRVLVDRARHAPSLSSPRCVPLDNISQETQQTKPARPAHAGCVSEGRHDQLSDWRVPGRRAPRPRVRATAWLRAPFAGAPPGQGQRAAEQEKFTQQAPDWTLGRVCLQGRPRRLSGNLGFGRAPPAPDP